jgi:hypothetical protein
LIFKPSNYGGKGREEAHPNFLNRKNPILRIHEQTTDPKITLEKTGKREKKDES